MTNESLAPAILILAGPNGAGKTTFAKRYLPRFAGTTEFLNADLIAVGLSPFSPERVAVKAGKLMLREIEERVQRKESFAFETTLSGTIWARRIPEWHRIGYVIHLVFLSLSSVEIAIERVRNRVAEGGHDIPEDVIRRRFVTGLENFETVYRPLVDRWWLYDLSGGDPRLLQESES